MYNPFAPLLRTIGSALARLRGPYGGGASGGWGHRAHYLLPGAKKDWLGAAGDLWRNSVVAICLGWLSDNFTDAELRICKRKADGSDDPIADHPLLKLLGPGGRPNRFYTADDLWAATILSYKVDGNAYWIKWRGLGGEGDVEQLWWEPHFNVCPVRALDSPNLVDYYAIRRPTGTVHLDPGDVVHFRDGIDPRDPTRGLARLKQGARNVVGLNDGETYTASIVGNLGGIGVVWTPDSAESVDEPAVRAFVRGLTRATSGENVGRVHGSTIPGHFDRLGLGPQEMALDTILDRPEASVCGMLGVSPMVVGLAVGAAMRSYANQEEADRQSWKNGLVPVQNRMARGGLTDLAREFAGYDDCHATWDRTKVAALGLTLKERMDLAVLSRAGAAIASENEARKWVELPPVDGGDLAPAEERAEAAEQTDAQYGDEGEYQDEGESEPVKAREREDGDRPFPVKARRAAAAVHDDYDPDALGYVEELDADDLEPEDLDPDEDDWHEELDDALFDLGLPEDRRPVKGLFGPFDEAKHPRGPGGKFASTGASKRPKHGARSRRKHGRGSKRQRTHLAEQLRRERAKHAGADGKGRRSALVARARGLRSARLTAPRLKWTLNPHLRAKGRNTPARKRTAAKLKAARAESRAEASRSPKAEGRGTEARKRLADKLKKARARVRAKEIDPTSHVDHAPGHVGDVPRHFIHFDPERFQYKQDVLNHATGSVGSLAGVKKWDPELAGVVQVWRDPANGKTYVVNGHNRLDLANKIGVDKLTVRFLDARNAAEARSKGAITNIAEGRGTAMDAAKFFQATGLKKADLEARGVPLREKIADDGLALANLEPRLFRRVIDGGITQERGAIIGRAGLDAHEQHALVDLMDKQPKSRPITNDTLKELTDTVRSARSKSSGGFDLFGDTGTQSLALHKASLQATIKQRLGREKKLFGTVARSRAASDLERGGNKIDAERSGAISREASEALDVFDRLKNTSGPISRHLNDAAERIDRGENRRKVEDETYKHILGSVEEAYSFGAPAHARHHAHASL